MRTIKTYGVRGLLEWQLSLPAGNATLLLHFTGGIMGTNGVLPAKYTTGNKVLQRLIEESKYFKSGRIVILRSQTETDGNEGDGGMGAP